MKRTLALLLLIACLVTGCVTSVGMAEGTQEAEFTLPYKGPETHITVHGWQSYKPVDPNTRFGKWWQEQLGNLYIDFEIPAEGADTKIELALASGDMPDIMNYRDPAKFMKAYGDGSRTLNLLDYAQYMPEYTERLAQFPHLSWYNANETTNYLYFPSWYDSNSEVWYTNHDLLDQYGIAEPTNYTEMLAAIEKVCAADPTKIGIHLYDWGFAYQFAGFSSLFGSQNRQANEVLYDYDLSKWVLPIREHSEVYRQAADAMAYLYSKGYLHPDFISISGELWDTIYYNGDSLFYYQYNDIPASEANTKILYNTRYIEPPTAEGVKPSIKTDYASDCTGWMYMVSNTTEHPELACAFLDFISSKEMAEKYYWGWENETYTVDADGKKAFTPEFLAASYDDLRDVWGMSGAMNYTFIPYISLYHAGDAQVAMWCDETKRALAITSEKLTNGDYVAYHGRVVPEFDATVQDKMTIIQTALDTYINEGLVAFVLGTRPMTEWDSFIEGLKDVGDVDWLLEQYNTAPQRPDRANQFQRNWLKP